MGSEPGSPSDEIERPPLRHIDKYIKPQFFGLTARYTVSIMAMIGFIISFGMKNNVSTAKIAKKSLTGVSGIALEFAAIKLNESLFHYFPVIEIELDGGRRNFRRFVIFLWLFDYTNSGRFLCIDFAGDQNIWHIHCVVIISESADHGRNVIGQCHSIVHDSIHSRLN